MRIRSFASALAVGGLVLTGGLAADPGEESDNGCRGTNEAQDRVGEESPAQAALERVEEIIDPDNDKCKDDANSASEDKGENGNRPGGED